VPTSNELAPNAHSVPPPQDEMETAAVTVFVGHDVRLRARGRILCTYDLVT